MDSNAGNKSPSTGAQIVVGLLVVATGILFLLDNLGFLGFRHALSFWPIAFIVGGASLMVSDDRRNGRVTGPVMIGVGIVLLLQRMGIVDVSWRVVWPLLMILAGGLIVYRTLGGGRGRVQLDKDGAADGSVIDVTAILGGVERRIATPDFRGGEVTALLGGCELDLRASSIVKEAVLNVFTVWGGITIKVPVDWTVVLNGTPVMGGFSQKTAPVPDVGKRLVVTGYAVMGGVDVRN
jgi:hypothetical protein